MSNCILIVTPKLSLVGGVSSYWNAIIPELKKYENLNVQNLEIGGHGKKILGPIIDQLRFRKRIKREINATVLNPSLGSRSFFRDLLFAIQLNLRKIPFIVFFRGWDLEFEKRVSKKYRKLFQYSFGKAKCIIILSDDFKIKLREWDFKGEIIVETTTVNNSLLEDFSFEEKGYILKENDKTRILFLSRLLKEKGINETIAAFKILNIKHNNLELIIAGDGKEYKELKAKHKNETNIVFLGHISGKEKIEILKNCQIYCLPSYSEGLPNSVLEAMAFGIPVITTRVGGLKKFFLDGKMGFFVDIKSVNQIVEKMEFLISNPRISNCISNYNYNYAKKYLLNTIVAKRLHNEIISVFNE